MLNKVWEKIKDAWEEMLCFLDKLSDFIAKLMEYSPVLWKDRDFDYAFILILLKYKLARTRSHIVRHQIIEKADEVGEQIAHAEELIRRILNDDYCAEEQALHSAKWGEWVNTGVKFPDGTTQWLPSRTVAVELGLEEQERQEQRAIYDRMELARKLDLDELFVHLRTHIEGWWD